MVVRQDKFVVGDIVMADPNFEPSFVQKRLGSVGLFRVISVEDVKSNYNAVGHTQFITLTCDDPSIKYRVESCQNWSGAYFIKAKDRYPALV